MTGAVSRPDPEQPENATKLRVFVERHAPRQFRDDDGVAHDSAMHVEMLAALDGLLAELDQTRQERDAAIRAERHVARAHRDAEAALVQAKRERDERDRKLKLLSDLAKSASSQAAAPDYDEEAIRHALWLLADVARAALVVATEPTLTNPTEGRSEEGDGGWDFPATRKRAGAEATSESVVPPSSEQSPATTHKAAGGVPGNAPAGSVSVAEETPQPGGDT